MLLLLLLLLQPREPITPTVSSHCIYNVYYILSIKWDVNTYGQKTWLPASFTGCLTFSKKFSSRFFAPEALKKKKPFSQKKFPLSFEIRVVINVEPHVSYQVFICFLINQFSRSWSQLAISFAIHRDFFFFLF